MTQREIVRTAVMSGGIWLILSGFSSLPSIFADFTDRAGRSDRDASEQVRDLFLVYLPSGILGLLLAATPGIYATLSSERWAARLVPDDDTDLEIRPSLILAVGSMLLGLSTGLSGAIALAASGMSFILTSIGGESNDIFAGMMVERARYGAFALCAGIGLFRWGSHAVGRAA
jgi:hypothetical protein